MLETRSAAQTIKGQRRSNLRSVNLGQTCLSLLLLLFFLEPRDFQCVEQMVMFCWLSCAESSFRCFCASSWWSRSVLKKSASVIAKDSALMVTVLTCSPSAPVFFSRVSLMAPFSIASRVFCERLWRDLTGRVASPPQVVRVHRIAASMASKAALPFVFDADCLERVIQEMTVVCCKWSCIMCRAVVTRSSKTCCSARVARSLRSRPSPARHHSSLAQPSAALPRDVAGELLLLVGH